MQVTLVDASSTARQLSALIREHDSISIAVAWGGLTPVADTLLANADKIRFILVGVDFCATEADLIDRFVDVPNAYVAKPEQNCFHPKIFYFESGTKAEAIIGSANFTKGGLGNNVEAGVHLRGAASDPFFVQVRDVLESYTNRCQRIDQELASTYRRQAKAAATKPRSKSPILTDAHKNLARMNSPLAKMEWPDFVKLVRSDRYHDYEKRINLLRAIQQIFCRMPSFAEVTTAEAKGIAGVLGEGEAKREGLADLDWGWFGSMGGAGTFAKLISLKDRALATALDAIPMRDDVTEDQFDEYVAAFTAAFSDLPRTAGLAPATRLLAMKRPDVFVCVNGGNQLGLAKALSFAPTTIKLENYWERVIDPIRQAPWYTTPRPVGSNMEIWDARAAMLDAIYYRPAS